MAISKGHFMEITSLQLALILICVSMFGGIASSPVDISFKAAPFNEVSLTSGSSEFDSNLVPVEPKSSSAVKIISASGLDDVSSTFYSSDMASSASKPLVNKSTTTSATEEIILNQSIIDFLDVDGKASVEVNSTLGEVEPASLFGLDDVNFTSDRSVEASSASAPLEDISTTEPFQASSTSNPIVASTSSEQVEASSASSTEETISNQSNVDFLDVDGARHENKVLYKVGLCTFVIKN